MLQFTTHGWRPDIKLFHHSFKLISSRSIKTFMIRCARCRFLMISEFFIQLQIYLCGLYVFHDFTNIKIMTFAAQMLREVSKNSKHHHFCIQNWMKNSRILIQSKSFFKVMWMWALKKKWHNKVYHLWLEAIRKLLQMRRKGFKIPSASCLV